MSGFEKLMRELGDDPVRASMPGSLLKSLNIINSGVQEKERPDVCRVDLHSHGP